jgi:hypothetical protein
VIGFLPRRLEVIKAACACLTHVLGVLLLIMQDELTNPENKGFLGLGAVVFLPIERPNLVQKTSFRGCLLLTPWF